MPADQGDGFMLEDTERLPWLEPAEPMEEARAVPLQKVLALVLLGLVLLAAIVGGGWWLKSMGNGPEGSDAPVIDAPGDYKIAANDPAARKYDVDGKEFQGEGDAAFRTSAGADAGGRIDPRKAPEMPMTDVVRAEAPKPVPSAKPKPAVAETGANATPAPTPASTPAASVSPTLSGDKIQLGAYNSAAIAEDAWRSLVKRFDELSGARHVVEPVKTSGRTLYRLRMAVADKAEAQAQCGKLRVAGENCWVVP